MYAPLFYRKVTFISKFAERFIFRVLFYDNGIEVGEKLKIPFVCVSPKCNETFEWNMGHNGRPKFIGHDVDGLRMTHFDRAFAFTISKLQQRHYWMEWKWFEWKMKKKKSSHVSNESESSLETVIIADGRQCLLKRFITEIEKSKSRSFNEQQNTTIKKKRTNNYLCAGEIKVFIQKLRLIQWKYIPNRRFIIVSWVTCAPERLNWFNAVYWKKGSKEQDKMLLIRLKGHLFAGSSMCLATHTHTQI